MKREYTRVEKEGATGTFLRRFTGMSNELKTKDFRDNYTLNVKLIKALKTVLLNNRSS